MHLAAIPVLSAFPKGNLLPPSIWYRKPEPYGLAASVPEWQREFASAACREAIHGIYNLLYKKAWMDFPYTMLRAADKPFQLHVAKNLGFRIQNTLITTDPALDQWILICPRC
jgi:hypothetical protein